MAFFTKLYQFRQGDLTNPNDKDSVNSYQQKGTDGKLSSFLNLFAYTSKLVTCVRVVAFFKGEVLDIYVDTEDVKYLGAKEDSEQVGEEEGNYCWQEL